MIKISKSDIMDKYRHLLFHLVGSLPGERLYHHHPNTWKSTGDTWVESTCHWVSASFAAEVLFKVCNDFNPASGNPALCCYISFFKKGFPTLTRKEIVQGFILSIRRWLFWRAKWEEPSQIMRSLQLLQCFIPNAVVLKTFGRSW